MAALVTFDTLRVGGVIAMARSTPFTGRSEADEARAGARRELAAWIADDGQPR